MKKKNWLLYGNTDAIPGSTTSHTPLPHLLLLELFVCFLQLGQALFNALDLGIFFAAGSARILEAFIHGLHQLLGLGVLLLAQTDHLRDLFPKSAVLFFRLLHRRRRSALVVGLFLEE